MGNKHGGYDISSKVVISVQALILIGFASTLYFDAANYRFERLFAFLIVCGIFLSNFFLMVMQSRKERRQADTIITAINDIKDGNEWKSTFIEEDKSTHKIMTNMKLLHDSTIRMEQNRAEILNIINSMDSNMEVKKVFEDLMPRLIKSMNSFCGAFYLANNTTGKLEIKTSLGFSRKLYSEFDLNIGEGFIGVAALQTDVTVIQDIPDDSIFIAKSFLGDVKPKNIMIVPITNNDILIGVLCLSTIYDYTAQEMESINMMRHYLGIVSNNSLTFERIKRLTNELKFQNSLIQSLNEELEQKINSRNMFLKSIIDSIKDYSIYVLDPEGVILEWNKGAELLFGYEEEEIKGKHVNILYPGEDVKSGLVKSRIKFVAKNGYFNENGWRYKKDGTKYYADISIFGLYNDAGELIGMTNVTQDITELKMAQNEIWFQRGFSKKMVELSVGAVIITDENMKIQFCNENAKHMLGSEEIDGKEIFALFAPKEKALMIDFINNQKEIGAEMKFKLKDSNKEIYIQVNTIKDELGLFENKAFYLWEPSTQ